MRTHDPQTAREQGIEGFMGECVICGEAVYMDDDPAEMHDAEMMADPEMFSEAQGGLVHAQCGLDHGWKIS